MLHGSETWKKNVVTLQRAEMRMVRWMCGIKLKDRFPSKELRDRVGIDEIALVLQQNRLRWYGHVLRKEDDDWEKKCMEYEAEGPTQRCAWGWDGILVPSLPIPADFTPIHTRARTDSDPSLQKAQSIPTSPSIFFVNQMTVTIVAILKIPHSAALTVNFKL